MSNIVGLNGKPIGGSPALPAEVERRGALALLQHLRTLQPSDACPLTDEDLAIFINADERSPMFKHMTRASYADYFTFFMSECRNAHNAAMAVLSE